MKFLDMFFNKSINTKNKEKLTKDEIANLLNISTEAYIEFERSYKKYALDTDTNIRKETGIIPNFDENMSTLIRKIVDELTIQTNKLYCTADGVRLIDFPIHLGRILTPEDISYLPIEKRPQLLGNYMTIQTSGGATETILWYYKKYLETRDIQFYNHFRQGLDILDIEPLMYEMLKLDPNTMSKWLPPIIEANKRDKFFKIPETSIIQVPVSMLQLSRIDYELINDITKEILNLYCREIFKLDKNKEYFVKTGTFSSKFDFRNAHVCKNEVNAIGEYLLFLSNQAVCMAGPACKPSIYGVSSNNEWVVREYIPDAEDNPCIYKGLPLRTEYRVFIDCDAKEVLGVVDYWDRDLLKKRFSQYEDANSPHSIHDYIVIEKHREVMDRRFSENKVMIENKVKDLLKNLSLKGQWSLDIMQNGKDFYIIDMGIAYNSALKDKLPENIVIKNFENSWLPKLPI